MHNEENKSTNPPSNLLLIAGLLLCERDNLYRVNPEPSPGPAVRPAPPLSAHRSVPYAPLPSTVRGRHRPRLRATAQSPIVPAAIQTPPSWFRSMPTPGSALEPQTGFRQRKSESTRTFAAP